MRQLQPWQTRSPWQLLPPSPPPSQHLSLVQRQAQRQAQPRVQQLVVPLAVLPEALEAEPVGVEEEERFLFSLARSGSQHPAAWHVSRANYNLASRVAWAGQQAN